MGTTRSVIARTALGAVLTVGALAPNNSAQACPPLQAAIPQPSLSTHPVRATGHPPRARVAALGLADARALALLPVSLQGRAARGIPAPMPGPRCDRSQPPGKRASYQGGSASALYDQVFRPSIEVPYLDTYVPQALTSWRNWDGAGHSLVLLGMYRTRHKSYLVGLDPDSGRAIGTVMIDPSHLGGMGFVGSWLFAQDDNPHRKQVVHPRVRRYRVDGLRAAMKQSAASGDKVYLRADGKSQRIYAVDFFAVDGDSVYAGNHASHGHGRMYRYRLNHEQRLQRAEGPWAVPNRAQGLVITHDDFIFSSDEGMSRGRLTVVRRGAPGRTDGPIACIWIPAMPEDMTVYGGELLLLFESGTTRYQHDHPVNRITQLHSGTFEALLTVTDPAVLKPGVHWAASRPIRYRTTRT